MSRIWPKINKPILRRRVFVTFLGTLLIGSGIGSLIGHGALIMEPSDPCPAATPIGPAFKWKMNKNEKLTRIFADNVSGNDSIKFCDLGAPSSKRNGNVFCRPPWPSKGKVKVTLEYEITKRVNGENKTVEARVEKWCDVKKVAHTQSTTSATKPIEETEIIPVEKVPMAVEKPPIPVGKQTRETGLQYFPKIEK